MTLNWNVSDPVHSTQAHQELTSVLAEPNLNLVSIDPKHRTAPEIPEGFPKLYCSTCSQYFDIDEELQQRLDTTSHRISLPEHHGKEMQILIQPKEGTEKLQEIMEKLHLLGEDRPSGLYFVCMECLFLTYSSDVPKSEVNEVEAPTHHGRKMSPLYINDKTP